MTSFLQHNGQPLKVAGYACLFDTPITIDEQTETFASGAFSPTLRRGAATVRALKNHRCATQWASVRDGSLRLWQDSVGLAFAARIQDTVDGRQLARSIADGHAGVSFRCRPLETERTASGYVIKAAMLTEISLIGTPAYPTAAWLSDPDLMDSMPDHALSLRGRWKEPRHDATAMLHKMARRVAARKPVPARAVTSRPQARSRAPAASPYVSMGFGLTEREWEEYAFQEDVGRRAHRDIEARKRARRKAGGVA